MKEFWSRLTAVKRLAWEVAALSLVVNVLGLASSLYSIQVLNRYLALGIDGTLVTLTLGALLALLAEMLARSTRLQIGQWLCVRADRLTAHAAFAAMTRSSYPAMEAMPQPARREALAGLATVQQSFGVQNLVAVIDGPFALLFLAVLFFMSPAIAALVLFFLLAVTLLTGVIYLLSEEPSRDYLQATLAWGSQQLTLSGCNELVRSFPVESHLRAVWKARLSQVFGSRIRVLALQNASGHVGYVASVLMSILIYALGARQIIAGTLDVGMLIGINILAARALSGATRVLQLVDPVRRGERSLEMLGHFARLPTERQEGMVLPAWSGGIAFEDVSFAYPRQPAPIVESLRLQVPAGGVYAVTGPNGAGKTSFARLLVGLQEPTRGRILIDGMDQRQALLTWWRTQYVYLPQEPAFFDGSLRDNLTLGNEGIGDETVMGLCREVGIGSFLDASIEGLSMQIPHGGGSIPLGIRRRLALVRALLVDGPLVVLDEPTEGIDVAGCHAIAGVLNRLAREKKTIFVMTNEAFIIKAAQGVIDLSVKPVPRITLAVPEEAAQTGGAHV